MPRRDWNAIVSGPRLVFRGSRPASSLHTYFALTVLVSSSITQRDPCLHAHERSFLRVQQPIARLSEAGAFAIRARSCVGAQILAALHAPFPKARCRHSGSAAARAHIHGGVIGQSTWMSHARTTDFARLVPMAGPHRRRSVSRGGSIGILVGLLWQRLLPGGLGSWTRGAPTPVWVA